MTFSETFLVFLVTLVVFLGVKFGFRKSCLCKRNDKYEVCLYIVNVQCTIYMQVKAETYFEGWGLNKKQHHLAIGAMA